MILGYHCAALSIGGALSIRWGHSFRKVSAFLGILWKTECVIYLSLQSINTPYSLDWLTPRLHRCKKSNYAGHSSLPASQFGMWHQALVTTVSRITSRREGAKRLKLVFFFVDYSCEIEHVAMITRVALTMFLSLTTQPWAARIYRRLSMVGLSGKIRAR